MKTIDKIKLLNIKNKFDANEKVSYPEEIFIESFENFHTIAQNHKAFCFEIFGLKQIGIDILDDPVFEIEIDNFIEINKKEKTFSIETISINKQNVKFIFKSKFDIDLMFKFDYFVF